MGVWFKLENIVIHTGISSDDVFFSGQVIAAAKECFRQVCVRCTGLGEVLHWVRGGIALG